MGPEHPARILCLADRADAELQTRELREAGVSCIVERADDGGSLIEQLDSFNPHVVIADSGLRTIDALTTIRLVRERRSEAPIIVCSAGMDDIAAVKLMKAGAVDYVRKDQLARLPAALRGAMKRRQTELAVRESLVRIEDLYDRAPCGFHSIDGDGLVVAMNEAELSRFGYEAHEVVGKRRIWELMAPDSRARFAATFPTFKSTGLISDLELDFIAKNGQALPSLVSATAVRDACGNFIRSRTVVYDITGLRGSQRSIAANISILKAEHEVSPDGILVVDENAKVLSYNSRFLEMWGLSPDLARTGDDGPLLEAVTTRLADPQGFVARVQWLYRHPAERARDEVLLCDGRVFDRYSGPMTRDDGSYIGRVWFFRDITERKQAEERLREEEAKFRSLVEQEISGIAIVRGDGTLAYVNPRFARMLGFDVGDVIGRPLLGFVPESERPVVQEHLHAQMEGEKTIVQAETVIRSRNGAATDVLVHAALASYEGQPASIAVALDITERNRSARALQRLNRTLRTVNACNELLVRATNEAELLQGMCKVAVDVGGYQMAWIGFAENDAGKTVRAVAAAGAGAGYSEKIQISWAECDKGLGPTGTAIRTGQPQVSNDLATDPNMAPWRERALGLSVAVGTDGAAAS